MSSQKQLTELQSMQNRMGTTEESIENSHYTSLNIISHDAYIFYEDETGGEKRFQGRIWGQKTIHKDGMTELLLLQERKMDNNFGSWYPFIYESEDPGATASNVLDLVPRQNVDDSAKNRVIRIGFVVSWLFISLLLGVILFNIEIDTTLWFFISVFAVGTTVTAMFYYELKRLKEDKVHTGKFFPDGPSIPLARSYIHPLTGDIMRFAGKVPPIEIKSSQVSFSKIRGFTVSEMENKVSYTEEINQFRLDVQKMTIDKNNLVSSYNGKLKSKEGKKAIAENQTEFDDFITNRRLELLKKYDKLIDSGEFNSIIKSAINELKDKAELERIARHIKNKEREKEDIHTKFIQVQIERDKYHKESRSWMRKANTDLNDSNVMLAARLAVLINQGITIDNYINDDLPNEKNNPISQVNQNLISAGGTLFVVIIFFVIGLAIHSSIKSALDRMGEWASFVYVLTMTIFLILGGIFMFNYSKSRLKDTMNNTQGSQKMVMTK